MRDWKRYIGIVLFVILCIAVFVISFIFGGKGELKKNNSESIFVEEESAPVSAEERRELVVEIKGEIQKPDVYKVSEGAIIKDLIDLAGGITAEGDTSNINRARKLTNNECIVIGKKGEVNEGVEGVSAISNGLVNINTASLSELDTLPDIGPSRADAIIKYREKNGGFKNIEEIKNISGIGEKSFEKLKDLICV